LYVVARSEALMDDIDEVMAWRTPEQERLIWMEGRTTGYRVDPVGEYVIGVATGPGYRLERGRRYHTVQPYQLVVLDPSRAHSGTPVATEPWAARLLVIELPDVAAGAIGLDLAFPDPRVGGPALAQRFLSLHDAMRLAASSLERESGVASFLQDLARFSPARRLRPERRTDLAAVRVAAQHLTDNLAENVTLDELAHATGTSKFHLVRQFRTVTGVPPHTFQTGQRVVRARRLLEVGIPPATVAALTGFVDQSHLHRHFRRRLGVTPTRYAHAFTRR
jgi:AraC-like DNA-binding protein